MGPPNLEKKKIQIFSNWLSNWTWQRSKEHSRSANLNNYYRLARYFYGWKLIFNDSEMNQRWKEQIYLMIFQGKVLVNWTTKEQLAKRMLAVNSQLRGEKLAINRIKLRQKPSTVFFGILNFKRGVKTR